VFRLLVFSGLLFFLQASALSAEIRMSVGMALPPYVISDQNKGIELDIVRESLALKGHKIVPVYMPFRRVASSFNSGATDGALTVNESSAMKDAIYSDSHVTYQNVAISLASRDYEINSIKDLVSYSIVAFQHATRYLGAEFAEMAKKNPAYIEKAQQHMQISLLFSKRIDVVVLDINIYKYYRKLEKRVNTLLPVDIFEIFEPTHYKVAFRDKAIQADFNEGLRELRASGRYQEIIESYIK